MRPSVSQPVKLSDGRGELNIAPVPQDPQMDNVCLAVTVSCSGFLGTNDEVWIHGKTFKSFLSDLRNLERGRPGDATMVSMSPRDFRLTIGSYDSVGHIAATGFMGKVSYGSTGMIESSIEFSIDLDPTVLRDFCAEIESLAPAG
jgi:hypothetical protein